MNLQTIITNLKNTIAGKEKLYASYAEELNMQYRSTENDSVTKMATVLATRQFLKINIDELKRILQDVEKCKTTDVYEYNSDPSDGPMIKMFRED